jgi:hypothetical protein
LMTNHVHLLVGATDLGSLSRYMHSVQRSHTGRSPGGKH